jgi:hypothetical protein
MEFGRFAAENRAIREKANQKRSTSRVHAHQRKDRRQVHADTKDPPDRMTATLKAIKDGLRRRWHYSIPEQGNGSGEWFRDT